MSHRTVLGACAFLVCVLSLSDVRPASAQYGQDKAKPEQEKKQDKPVVPEAEGKAANKVIEAKDPSAKVKAASEFLKKYPKSAVRGQLAKHVAAAVRGVTDAPQRITLTESYLETFTEPGESEDVTPNLIGDYVAANRNDDAMRAAGPWLEAHPNDLLTLINASIAGTQELLAGNSASPPQNRKYATNAIAILEGNQKPQDFPDAEWQAYKTKWLPQLNYMIALNANREGDRAETRARLEKAVALKPSDPNIYAMLAGVVTEEYDALATEYAKMPPGPGKDATFKKALAQMDASIELIAQAIALTGDDPRFKDMREQMRGGLEANYKFRHNNSTEGMQQLIDKYKKPAAAP